MKYALITLVVASLSSCGIPFEVQFTDSKSGLGASASSDGTKAGTRVAVVATK